MSKSIYDATADEIRKVIWHNKSSEDCYNWHIECTDEKDPKYHTYLCYDVWTNGKKREASINLFHLERQWVEERLKMED